MDRLDGKVAIVTGSARGLGRSIALKLADEGANLLIVTRSNMTGLAETKRLVEEKGVMCVSARVDISVEQDTLDMADLAVKEFGSIDILVNNAGTGFHERKPFFEISGEEWDQVMAVNIKGSWQCIKAVFPQMKKKGKGSIINIGSETFLTGSAGFAQYATSKGGVLGLTRAVAREAGEYGIRVNVAAGGFLANEAGLALLGGDAGMYDIKPNCIKRVGRSEDVVGTVAFLASDESNFITGQLILVDGGRILY